jgi:hypothetical protein
VFADTWCGDVVYVWDKSVMPKTRMLLQRLQASSVYGETLELEPEAKDADTAFGFVFRTAGGTLILRSIPSYEGNALLGLKGSSSMQSGLQEMPEGRQIASIVGRVIRLLDMTNEEEEWVRWSVMRLGAELRICDYSPVIVGKAVRRVQDVAWLDLRWVARWCTHTMLEMRMFARVYDELREAQRETDVNIREAERRISRVTAPHWGELTLGGRRDSSGNSNVISGNS